jgi:molybdopterin/thiamine biosynthesis adenylyltransferase
MAPARKSGPAFSSFPKLVEVQCRPKKRFKNAWSMTDRQERFQWWSQPTIRKAGVLLVGAGGLGSNQGKILVQMGFSKLSFVDGDLVEDSNRNRQMFIAEDVGLPKAHQIIKNLEPYATATSTLRGYFMHFEDWCQQSGRGKYSAICCGVDSIPSMLAVSAYGLKAKTPVIFTNISADGEAARIFIQRSTQAEPCFACYRPESLNWLQEKQSCAPVPAIADILHVAVGLGARAIVGEILGVPIGEYNCRDFTFTGFDIKRTLVKRPECPLCRGAGLRESQAPADCPN